MLHTARPLKLEHLDTFKYVFDAQINPNGQTVAFCVGALTRSETKLTPSHIWLAEVNGGAPLEFSTGPRADLHPRWSPDGTRMAFLSDREADGKLQLYIIPRTGGEAVQLTDFDRGLTTPSREVPCFQWSPDGRAIAFLMADEESKDARDRRERQGDAIEFEATPRYTRVWVVDVATKKTHAVTQGQVQVWEFDWSPDGKDFALIVSDAPYEWSWYQARLARVAAKGGKPRTVMESKRQFAQPRWSPDGYAIAYLTSIWSDRGIVSGDIAVVDAHGEARTVTRGYPGSVGWTQWLGPHSILAASYEQGDSALNVFDTQTGTCQRLWKESTSLAEAYSPRFSRARQGTLAVVLSSPAAPRDIFIAHPNDGDLKWKQLTHLNPVRKSTLGAQEIVRWASTDGKEIRGILIKPVGYKPGQRVPLVVIPHGGPTSLSANGFYGMTAWGQHLAARGLAVLLPNYRGSTGWGLEFAESNVGDLGGMDFQDVMSGVDALIAQGLADPEHLGIGGWSYGGFMTAWAITQTGRFKAAVIGAGITNWQSFHGNSHLCTWDAIHYNASPYEREGVYQRFAPMNYVANVTTPTLILHGEKDRDVPLEQDLQFYRALKDHGVETQLVIYPREGHGISETKHVHDLLRRMLDWFESHI